MTSYFHSSCGKFHFGAFVFLLLISPRLVAQPTGYTAVTDATAFSRTFISGVKKIQSIRSSFRQEKNLSVLDEKIVSEGKFWFQRENKVRIEYMKPFHYLMIINGDQVILRDDQKETRGSATSNKVFQQVNGIVLGCVQGTIFENKDFSHKVYQSEKQYLLEMTPLSKTLRGFLQSINVIVDKADESVTSIELIEANGDNTVIRFMDKKLNEKSDDALFVR